MSRQSWSKEDGSYLAQGTLFYNSGSPLWWWKPSEQTLTLIPYEAYYLHFVLRNRGLASQTMQKIIKRAGGCQTTPIKSPIYSTLPPWGWAFEMGKGGGREKRHISNQNFFLRLKDCLWDVLGQTLPPMLSKKPSNQRKPIRVERSWQCRDMVPCTIPGLQGTLDSYHRGHGGRNYPHSLAGPHGKKL